jgi:putative ABC transport system ATP-binding protein
MNERAVDDRYIIEVSGVYKAFENGRIRALNGADLRVKSGEFVAVMGPSGCGKSTLLHLIAALETPDSGTISVGGTDLADHRNLSQFRAREVGLVFQMHNLLPTLTAGENIQIPMFESRLSSRERKTRADQLLSLVGLTGKGDQRPTELSGGERQRVAVARALANDPVILLADEPTGSLDSKAGQRILDLLEELRVERGLTIVLITHDPGIASRADRIVRMLDGQVVGEDAIVAGFGVEPTSQAVTATSP